MARGSGETGFTNPETEVTVTTMPLVDTRWFIEEYFPSRINAASGIVLEAKWIRIQDNYFTSVAAANTWTAARVPDYTGGSFRVREEKLRTVSIQQWFVTAL